MITIINYGLGNINAFANVYKRLNIPCTIANRREDLMNAKKIILPGVGSFDHAMTMLQRSGMRDTLDELVLQKKVPVLGICVGMQMLSHSSSEGDLPGLCWIDGIVKKFYASEINNKTRLPHMGWNTVRLVNNNPLMEGFDTESRFYFLHSYYFVCNKRSDIITTTDYGITFTSSLNSDNIFGVQFHPEKSHSNGIRILKNFAKL